MVSVDHGELLRGSHPGEHPGHPDLVFAPVAPRSDPFVYSVARIRCVVTRPGAFPAGKGAYISTESRASPVVGPGVPVTPTVVCSFRPATVRPDSNRIAPVPRCGTRRRDA